MTFDMKFRLLGCFLFMLVLTTSSTVGAVTQHTEILTRIEWPEHENGANIIALPQVNQTLRRFDENESISIEIRYPGGDIGRQWAEGLRHWFVSFGVPLEYLSLFPGADSDDKLIISLIDRR